MQHHARTFSVLTRTLDLWGGVKGQNNVFFKVVMLHIKLKRMEHRAPCKHTFCHNTHSRPLGRDQKIKIKKV